MDLSPWLDQPLLDDRFPLPLDAPFTYRTARTCGLTSRNLATLVHRGFLKRPIKSVYLASQAGDSPRLRAQVIQLVVPEGAVVCDRHAGWLLGAEMVLAPNEHLALRPTSVFRPSGLGRLRNDLVDSGERNLRPEDVTEVDGVLVTTPLRTAWDLGRTRYPEPAIAGLDALLRLGVFTRDELVAGVERFKGQRWVTTLRLVAPLADGRAASPGESVLRLRWIQAGLPEPTPQLEVWARGQLLAILDLASEDLRYAAEYDGAEWHSSPEQRQHDEDRRAEVSDHAWVVDAFTKSNVFGAHADADILMRAGAVRARHLIAGRVRL